MRPIDIGDIVDRLLDLRTYSPELAQRMEHETELPEDAVPFLIDRIECAFVACEDVTAEAKPRAFSELTAWLIISYQFYLMRLAREGGNPWMFTFPKTGLEVHH
jgi:hypothetical protein